MPSRCAFYQFGEFALDLNQQRLIRLESREAIALTAKVFDTLLCLIERAGETIAVFSGSLWTVSLK